ncbi:LemA family protein [Thermodesulfobacteriota bacterium]
MSGEALITICIAVVTLIIVVGLYNTLVGRKNMVNQAFSSIKVMCKKRYDLIPNLLATAEKYMKHENDIMTKVSELRAKALSGTLNDDQQVQVENQLSKTLKSLFAVSEAYPDLKANQNFLQLQGSLNEVEEQLSASRRAYNGAVTSYNNGVEMFPLSVFAKFMGYQTKEWLDVPEEELQPIRIS